MADNPLEVDPWGFPDREQQMGRVRGEPSARGSSQPRGRAGRRVRHQSQGVRTQASLSAFCHLLQASVAF